MEDKYTVDWSKYFDHIYCFHFLGKSERLRKDITAELDRVGILKSGIFNFVYTSRDPWEKALWDASPRCRKTFNVSFLNLGLATARTLREALALGYQRVLFLEDDIRFLKDLKEIEKILAATPNESRDEVSIVQYDKFLPWSMTPSEYRRMVEVGRFNDYFFSSRGKSLYSGACFMATKKGMEALLRFNEDDHPTPSDGVFQMVGVKTACADRNMAIQIFYDDAMAAGYFNGKGNTHHKAYAPMELDYSLYNVPNGYGYKSLTATV